MDEKKGALTEAELQDVWKSAVDFSYSQPILEAGDGNGLEVYGQLFTQLARVSRGIDTTSQAMFLRPWSGQTAPPAAGAAFAQVTLTFKRDGLLDRPLILGRGLIFVQEETTDWEEDGGVVVLTGRRYVLTEDLVFHPGERGPFQVVAQAERPGYGYNNPLPNTIKRIAEPGFALSNEHATINPILPPVSSGDNASIEILTPNMADTFVPDNVGQYVYFTDGLNVGQAVRIAAFAGPDFSLPIPIGSTVEGQILFSADATVFAGTFQVGEQVTWSAGVLQVVGERVVGGTKLLTLLLLKNRTPSVGDVVTGVSTGATLTVRTVLHDDYAIVAEAPVAGVGGATWRILGWDNDWQLTVTHPLSPAGGLAAWLDEIGKERDLSRAAGEDDEGYRSRLEDIGDVVTPNAIVRAINKILAGIPFCFREVGTANFPGFFYDGDGEPPSGTPHGIVNDAYDAYCLAVQGAVTGILIAQEPMVLETTDMAIQWATGIYAGTVGLNIFFAVAFGTKTPPGGAVGLRLRGLQSGATVAIAVVTATPGGDNRRWHLYLSPAEFRAFFLVCVQKLGIQDFGMSYDVGNHDAFDATLLDNFFDGYPAGDASIYGPLYQAIDAIRAGGVGFDLCQDTVCAA